MEQDSWLAALLTGRPNATLAGSDLAIEQDGTVIRLLDRRIADPDLLLVGPTWQVDSLISAGSASSAPWEHPATLVFGTDGRVAIDTGCNTGEGRYAAGQGSLRVSEIGLTKRGCSGDSGRLEQAVLEVLRADQLTFSIEAKSLTLSAGEHGLGLRAE
jgi:heat shock protein HslJ